MIRYYTGDIQPDGRTVFVFGSNPEGLQGHSYAIPTKDLRVRENNGYRSISPERITESIRRMYALAADNPSFRFMIAYRNTYSRSLNGYTGIEMIRMFLDAGPIPPNVYVSEEWYRTGMFR